MKLVVSYWTGDPIAGPFMAHIPAEYESAEKLLFDLQAAWKAWREQMVTNRSITDYDLPFPGTNLILNEFCRWLGRLPTFNPPIIRTIDEWFQQEAPPKAPPK